MLYLVYKTTNLLNGKYYIGTHRTEDRSDGYLGSGTLLKRAISKYGEDKFTREILFEANTTKEMFEKERELVVIAKDSYNLQDGGFGGWEYINKLPRSKKHRESLSLSSKGNQSRLGIPFTEESKNKISISKLGNQAFKGKCHSANTKEKISRANKGRIPWNKGKTIVQGDQVTAE